MVDVGLEGRNINYEVFAKFSASPPHIPRYPPLSIKDKWEGRESLEEGFLYWG